MPVNSRNYRSRSINTSEDLVEIQSRRLSANVFETMFDELKCEVVTKIDREMSDSANAREFISQKYDELTNKIKNLAELDATVSGFRSDVRSLERSVADLSRRVQLIENRSCLVTPKPSQPN